MLGLRLGINLHSGYINAIPCKSSCLLYATPETDKIGRTTFDAVRPVAMLGDGSQTVTNINLADLSLTYVDATTGTTVSSVFDESGAFVIPTNGLTRIDVENGSSYLAQELIKVDGTFNSSLSDQVNGYTLVISNQMTTPAEYDDTLISYINAEGYTLADGYQWQDSDLEDVYAVGTRIPKGAGFVGNEIYVTSDNYTYVTADGYSYVMKE